MGYKDDYEHGASAFNDLALLPPGIGIPLGDGRTLFITEWHPRCNDRTMSGILDVRIEGFVRREKEK